MSGRHTLENAVRALAAVCDGAYSRDDMGFNGTDAKFGKRIAELPPDAWTPAMRREAWEMLAKYRHQLANAGIVYDAIPEPDGVQSAAQAEARQDARRALLAARRNGGKPPASSKLVALQDDMTFSVAFPYDAGMVAEVRAVPGRRWHGVSKLNTVPAAPWSIRELNAFAIRHGFDWTDEAAAKRDELLATPDGPATEAPEAPPQETPAGVYWNDGLFEIAFPYDPDMVEEVKQLDGRSWVKDRRVWTVPPTSIETAEKLGRFAHVHGLAVSIEAEVHLKRVGSEMKARLEASSADDADVTFENLPPGLEPFGFQKAGVAYAMRVKRCLIADEMGLGKTIQALLAILKSGVRKVVIVTPAAVKFNWLREINVWLPGRRVLVVESRTTRGQIEWAETLVVNYDILKVHHTDPKNKRSAYVADRLLADIIKWGPEFMVLDESHYVKSAKARRTKACKLLSKGALASSDHAKGLEWRLLLTGTPVMNRPQELISQLQILDRLDDMGGYSYFTRTYCGAFQTRWGRDVSGSGNLLNLNERLRATCFVRRLKADVLTDLPDKMPPAVVELDISNRKEYQRAEDDLIAWLMSTARDEEEAGARALAAMRAEQLVRMSALARLAAKGMMDAAKKWIQEFRDADENLLIFAWHKDIVHEVGDMLGAPVITGDTPLEERVRIARSFTERPDEVFAAACNIQAGGTGLDGFQGSCHNAAFLELAWNPALHDQATDRLHRIGQRDIVTPWYLIAKDTIYEDKWSVIQEKRQIVAAASDGVDPEQHQQNVVAAVAARLRKRGSEL